MTGRQMVDVKAGGKCYEAVIHGYSGKLEGNLQGTEEGLSQRRSPLKTLL